MKSDDSTPSDALKNPELFAAEKINSSSNKRNGYVPTIDDLNKSASKLRKVETNSNIVLRNTPLPDGSPVKDIVKWFETEDALKNLKEPNKFLPQPVTLNTEHIDDSVIHLNSSKTFSDIKSTSKSPALSSKILSEIRGTSQNPALRVITREDSNSDLRQIIDLVNPTPQTELGERSFRIATSSGVDIQKEPLLHPAPGALYRTYSIVA